jgi:hypothetical protein
MRQLGGLSFYHRTSSENACVIVESGFQNSTGYLFGNRAWTGVWLTSRPLDRKEGAETDTLLKVKLDVSERELGRWEWTGERRCFREWLIPAALINRRMTAEIVSHESVSELAA